ECLQDADMGEAACSASGQHDADSTPRDEACESLDVSRVARAHMLVGLEQSAAKREMLRQVRCAAGWVQQEKLWQAACAVLCAGKVERPLRKGPIRTGEKQHAIGLPHAEMRPCGIGTVAAVEDDIVLSLETIEPFRRLLCCRRIQYRRA